jgi:hypothetical protein
MTCDWGDCDEPVTAYRLDEGGRPEDARWLPVCTGHAVVYPPGYHCGNCTPMHSCPDDARGPGPCDCLCQYTVEDIMELEAL